MTCRLLFSLLSSVLPSLAIGFWLAIALPSLSSSSHRLSPLSNSLACVTTLWVGVLLDALAAVVGMPSLSSAVNVARMRVPPHCMECRSLFLLLSLAMPSSAVAMASSTIISCLRYSTHSCVYRRSVWCAAHCSRCCRWLCHRRLSCRPRRGSHQLTSLLASLACVPPLYVTRRSLLLLLLSAMPSSAVVSASPSFLSAVVVARLARVLAAALRGVPLAALAAVVG